MFKPTICLDCNHPEHLGRDCAVSFDGGPGRHTSCRCTLQKSAIDQIEEDEQIIRRHLPLWQRARLTRLVNTARGKSS